MSLEDHLFLQNQHWEAPFDVPLFYREMYSDLIESLNHKFIITLVGPRRVGKTTMLQQLINHLISEKGVDRRQILYFSLDLHRDDLLSIYNAYISHLSLPYRGNYYLIFDEIQYLENWASHVKILYDNLDCKIYISGSSASDLRRGKESLAGREFELFLPPLSFTEYLDMKKIKPVSDYNLWRTYLQYMDHQLPELVSSKISEKEYISQLVDKVINNDLIRLYNIRDTTPIDTIFRLICKAPGDVIITLDLSQELSLDRRTVQQYLQILEQSLLIRKVYNYSKNPRKSEKRHKRYYPFYTSLHWYISPYPVEFGKKAETEVAFQLSAEYFWNERGKEIDFIIGEELEKGVEVKMRNIVTNKFVRSLLNSKFVKKKYLITKKETEVQVDNPDLIVLPLHRVREVHL